MIGGLLLALLSAAAINLGFLLQHRGLAQTSRSSRRAGLAVLRNQTWLSGPAIGWLSFIDNTIDSTSGTIGVKATFENQDGVLWPGAFVTVAVTVTVEADALAVPLAAVQTGQDGRFVFVVKPDSTVEVRPVMVAREADDQAVIGSGLSENETVVVEGQLRLSPGTKVAAQAEKPAPAADAGTPTEPGS